MEKETKNLIYDAILIILALVLLLVTGLPDIIMAVSYFWFIPYLYLTKRKEYLYEFGVASAFALIWISVARDFYQYKNALVTVVGLPIFPLFAWACGLFASFLLCEHAVRLLKVKMFIAKLGIFYLIYIIPLVLIESVGYHYFGIQLTTNYPGLPLCNCIHAPLWFQMVYLLMGPVYFTVCYWLEKANRKK